MKSYTSNVGEGADLLDEVLKRGLDKDAILEHEDGCRGGCWKRAIFTKYCQSFSLLDGGQQGMKKFVRIRPKPRLKFVP